MRERYAPQDYDTNHFRFVRNTRIPREEFDSDEWQDTFVFGAAIIAALCMVILLFMGML